MCIINLTSFREIDHIIDQLQFKKKDSAFILGIFIPSQIIQKIIEVKHDLSFITIHIKSQGIDVQLIHSMDNVSRNSICNALDRFEEFVALKS